MEFHETFTIKAPIQQVWDFLWNPRQMLECVPGCEDVEQVDENNFRVLLKVKVGFLSANFKAKLSVTEKKPPHFFTSVGTGEDSRLGSMVKQTNRVTLTELSAGATEVDLKSDLSMFGKLGTLGYGVIKGKAAKLTEEFAANVRQRLEK